jgi:hypothetical protein
MLCALANAGAVAALRALRFNTVTHHAANFQRRVSCKAVVLVDQVAQVRRADEGLAAWFFGVNICTTPLGLQKEVETTTNDQWHEGSEHGRCTAVSVGI